MLLDRYLTGIGVCLFMLIPYVCFRREVFNTLHERGVRRRHFYKYTAGLFSFLTYRRLDKEYGCRTASVLSILFCILFPLVTLFHTCLGWWEAIPTVADQAAVSALAILTAVMTGFTVVWRNYRLFESPFVLLAALRIRNERGNFLNTACYSVVLDFIYILFPVVISSIMYFL